MHGTARFIPIMTAEILLRVWRSINRSEVLMRVSSLSATVLACRQHLVPNVVGSVHVWTRTEQAEVPAVQWLSGRDFTSPSRRPPTKKPLRARAAETIIRDPTNGVGINACLAPRAEPIIEIGG